MFHYNSLIAVNDTDLFVCINDTITKHNFVIYQ